MRRIFAFCNKRKVKRDKKDEIELDLDLTNRLLGGD